jgi:hypothetical protein
MGWLLTIGKYLKKLMEWLMNKEDQENPRSSGFPSMSKIITTIAAYSVVAIVGIAWWSYNDTNDRIRGIEERVSFLYQDKVSRAEFREEMTQMRLQIEGTKSDIIARQEATKTDILARLDLIIPHITRANKDR